MFENRNSYDWVHNKIKTDNEREREREIKRN